MLSALATGRRKPVPNPVWDNILEIFPCHMMTLPNMQQVTYQVTRGSHTRHVQLFVQNVN